MNKLKEGDMAPDFECLTHEGKIIKLLDFRGKKVVLYFYPKDLTPGCTNQACNLRDNYEELTKNNYVILGVSKDSVKLHQKFIEAKKLPFILLSDENLEVQHKYGVWAEKTLFGVKYMGTLRNTFVIDENGKIIKIIDKVKTGSHAKQILS